LAFIEGANKVSKDYEEELKKLHKEEKLSDFEYNQLVCLNYIVGNLVNIDTQLRDISNNLQGIKYGVDTITSK
jgi:hypothetical protein